MFSKTLYMLAMAGAFSTLALAGNNQQSNTTTDSSQQQTQTVESTNMPASPHQTQVLAAIEDRFKQIDVDGDGQISEQEGAADSDLAAKWADLDTDLSGSLNYEEFTVHQQEVLAMENQSRFQQLDSNADGQLSQEEANQNSGLAKRWSELDSDASGSLNQEEFSMFQDDTDKKSQ
jgi:Ca2+-binding EF-hand superfamily protein